MKSDLLRYSGLGPTELALESAWVTTSKTWIVVLPASAAAIAWAATVSFASGGEGSPDQTILIAFFALLISTACAVACTTVLASASHNKVTSPAGWRIGATALTIVAVSLAGGIVAYTLQSFFLTWFVCAFVFMYAVPMAATGKHGCLGSLFASARLAIRQMGTTLIAAILAEVIVALALGLGSFLSAAPFIGAFLQALTMQLAFGFLAVFALNVLRSKPAANEVDTHYPLAS